MTNSRAFTRVLTICAALLLGVLTAQPARANFEDGVRAYLAEDYAAALELWRPLAEEGHAPAQFGMGLAHENGRGVERDLTEAAVWYRKAAEQDLADAQFNLGNLYLNASGVPRDPIEAVRWYRRAAEQEMPHAQVNLGYSYETGSGVTQDAVKAVAWYRRAAEQNFPQAQYYLGAAYERGSGVETDPAVAAAWYQRAAEQGVVLAAKRLDALKANGIEPAVIDEAGAADQDQSGEPDTPEMAETAPSAEPAAEAEEKVTNLIEREAPTEPEAPAEPAPPEPAAEPVPPEPAAEPVAETVASESAPATARAGERVSTLIGSFRLRLASYRQPANAEKGWRILSEKHNDLLFSFNYAVSEVDLGAEKGIYHRLEAGPAGSREEAAAICAEIKSRGDSCVVVRP